MHLVVDGWLTAPVILRESHGPTAEIVAGSAVIPAGRSITAGPHRVTVHDEIDGEVVNVGTTTFLQPEPFEAGQLVTIRSTIWGRRR